MDAGLWHPVCSGSFLLDPTTMSGRTSIFALRDALVSVASIPTVEPDLQRQIRDHVHAVVDELKSFGWTADRINLALKEIALDAGVQPSHAIIVESASATKSDALLASLMRWSLERFRSNQSAMEG